MKMSSIRSWDAFTSRILFVSSLLICFEKFVRTEVASIIWGSNKRLHDIITLQFPKAFNDLFYFNFFPKPVGHIKSCCILIPHPISAVRLE